MPEQAQATVTCPACFHDHAQQQIIYARSEQDKHPVCPECGYQYTETDPDTESQAFSRLVSSPSELPRPKLSVEETRRRLPAIDYIEDDQIRLEVIELSRRAPAYFWVEPAANGDYHHELCRNQHGLWAHSLMVSTGIEYFSDSWVAQGRIDEDEVDVARAAAILHDQRKLGPHHAPEDSSTSDHNLSMADVIREESRLPEDVAVGVEEHMGPFYDGPAAETELGKLVHTADMAASTDEYTPTVLTPVPDELLELGVERSDL
jgi:Zn ribbon nucleic-acid-binding protein